MVSFKKLKENIIVLGIFTGILLPLRLFFYDFLHDYWIGAFGVTSLTMFIIFYLSKKKKLGSIGMILISSIEKKAKSKWLILIITQSVFFIYFLSLIIFGITYADPELTAIVKEELNKNGITDLQSTFTKTIPTEDLSGTKILDAIKNIFLPTKIGFTIYKTFNDLSGGFILPLFTVWVVEEIEVLGIALFLRYGIRINTAEVAK